MIIFTSITNYKGSVSFWPINTFDLVLNWVLLVITEMANKYFQCHTQLGTKTENLSEYMHQLIQLIHLDLRPSFSKIIK